MINNMNKNSVCIFAESGEYVKFHNLLSISMAAIVNDMEVNIFFLLIKNQKGEKY